MQFQSALVTIRMYCDTSRHMWRCISTMMLLVVHSTLYSLGNVLSFSFNFWL